MKFTFQIDDRAANQDEEQYDYHIQSEDQLIIQQQRQQFQSKSNKQLPSSIPVYQSEQDQYKEEYYENEDEKFINQLEKTEIDMQNEQNMEQIEKNELQIDQDTLNLKIDQNENNEKYKEIKAIRIKQTQNILENEKEQMQNAQYQQKIVNNKESQNIEQVQSKIANQQIDIQMNQDQNSTLIQQIKQQLSSKSQSQQKRIIIYAKKTVKQSDKKRIIVKSSQYEQAQQQLLPHQELEQSKSQQRQDRQQIQQQYQDKQQTKKQYEDKDKQLIKEVEEINVDQLQHYLDSINLPNTRLPSGYLSQSHDLIHLHQSQTSSASSLEHLLPSSINSPGPQIPNQTEDANNLLQNKLNPHSYEFVDLENHHIEIIDEQATENYNKNNNNINKLQGQQQLQQPIINPESQQQFEPQNQQYQLLQQFLFQQQIQQQQILQQQQQLQQQLLNIKQNNQSRNKGQQNNKLQQLISPQLKHINLDELINDKEQIGIINENIDQEDNNNYKRKPKNKNKTQKQNEEQRKEKSDLNGFGKEQLRLKEKIDQNKKIQENIISFKNDNKLHTNKQIQNNVQIINKQNKNKPAQQKQNEMKKEINKQKEKRNLKKNKQNEEENDQMSSYESDEEEYSNIIEEQFGSDVLNTTFDSETEFDNHLIKDRNWENKFVSNLGQLISSYSKIPTTIDSGDLFISMTIGSLIIIIIIVTTIVSTVQVNNYTEEASNILLSGFRSPYLARIQYFLLRTIIDFDFIMPHNPISDIYQDNYVWKDDSHMSTNHTLILSLLQATTHYLSRIHIMTHFGNNQYSITNDQKIDNIHSKNLPISMNVDLLFKQNDCYLSVESCDSAEQNRMFNIRPPIYGFQLLFSRMRAYIQQLSHMDGYQLNETNEELRFISSAIRQDLSEGMDSLMHSITDSGKLMISNSQSSIIIMTIIFGVSVILLLIFVTAPWQSKVKLHSDISHRILDLIPLEALVNNIQFLSSMCTNHEEIDNARKRIIEDTDILIGTINKYDKEDDEAQDAIDNLIQQCKLAFELEEKEMKQFEYNKTKRDKHKYDHELILHRLNFLQKYLVEQNLIEQQLKNKSNFISRILADVMRIGEVSELQNQILAIKFLVCRTVTQLFDRHFIELDTEFAEEVGLIIRGTV